MVTLPTNEQRVWHRVMMADDGDHMTRAYWDAGRARRGWSSKVGRGNRRGPWGELRGHRSVDPPSHFVQNILGSPLGALKAQ
jgi:hypothetical protein